MAGIVAAGAREDGQAGDAVVRAAILSGRGAVLFTDRHAPERAAFHAAAAAAGRAGEVRVVDLSAGTRDQAPWSREGLVVPDLDALATTPFAEDLLAGLDAATARSDFFIPAYTYEDAARRRETLERARREDPGGPGAWDRIMAAAAAASGPFRGRAPAAARAGRSALLLSDAWPGLDGVTPTLDLRAALDGGLTLVLVHGEGRPADLSKHDRIAISTEPMWRLFSENAAPGTCVVTSRWAAQLVLALATHPQRRPSPDGTAPVRTTSNDGLLVDPAPGRAGDPRPPDPGVPAVPGTAPEAAPMVAEAPGPGAPGAGCAVLSVDAAGWPTVATMARIPARCDPEAAAAGIASGAFPPDLPFGFALDVGHAEPETLLALGRAVAGRSPRAAGLAARVDRELAAACEMSGGGSLLHAWTRAGDARRRRQFALAWGALADLGRLHGLGPFVDAGRPSLPEMARILGLDAARARRFVGLPVPLGAHADAILRLASRMRPDRLPPARDAAAWGSFLAVASIVPVIQPGAAYREPPAHVIAFFDRCGRRGWRDAPLTGDERTHLSTVGDVAIGLMGLAGAVPTDEEDPDSHGLAVSILLDAADPRALAAISCAWHADAMLRQGSSLDLPLHATWPAAFPGPVDLGEGIRATALSSYRELIAEGCRGPDGEGFDGLDHCVASYAKACLAGASAIVSLRGADGRRLSTAELVAGAAGPVVAQHRGPRNMPPPPEAAAALRRLLSLVSRREVRMRPLDPAPPARHGGEPGEGVDPEVRADILDDLARRWARILPRQWRHGAFPPLSRAMAARAAELAAAREGAEAD